MCAVRARLRGPFHVGLGGVSRSALAHIEPARWPAVAPREAVLDLSVWLPLSLVQRAPYIE